MFPVAHSVRRWLGSWLLLVCGLNAAPGQLAPVVTSDPQNVSGIAGTNITFSILATGQSPLIYRWYKQGALVEDDGVRVFGANSNNLQIRDIIQSDAGGYWATVSNKHGTDTSGVATLTVILPPQFTLQPADVNAAQSSAATFSAQVTGTGPFSYQWRKDGTNLTDDARTSGSTGPTLSISNVQVSDWGLYSLVASNIAGPTTSRMAALRVAPVRVWGNNFFGQNTVPAALTDVIAIDYGAYRVLGLHTNGDLTGWGNGGTTREATNLVAFAAGDNFGLGITRQGTIVGWGSNESGQRNFPEGLSNVVEVAAGSYHGLALREDGTVVAWGTDSHGQATVPAGLSNVIAISAGAYHSLALKSDGSVVGFGNNYPYNQATAPSGLDRVVAISCGLEHNLALQAGGYVWAWGDNYYGQVGTAYALSGIASIEAGHFHSTAIGRNGSIYLWGDNSGGQITLPAGISNVVALSAGNFGTAALLENPFCGTRPDFIGTPFSRAIYKDGTTVLKPRLTGSRPMNFQWFFNGQALPGQNNPWLLMTGMQTNQSGPYHVVVSNRFGVSTSGVTTVSVELQKPYFTQQPQSAARTTGQNITFWATASGSSPLTYQWYYNGNPLAGQNGTWLYLDSLQTNNAGDYWSVAINAAGFTTSSVATLTVVVPVTITKQPESQSWLEGTNASLTVATAGTEPITYQWYKNNQPVAESSRIQGATSNTLTVLSIQPEDAGEYRVFAYNNWANWQQSAPAMITVLTSPKITSPPSNVTAPASTNVSFTVVAEGTAPLNYQWLFEGLALNGRTSSILTLTNVQSWNAGSYTVAVTNLYGSVTSTPAILSVTPSPATITSLSTSRVASVGQTVTLSVTAKGSEPFYYQWQRGSTNLPGVTGQTCVIGPLNATLAGTYNVVVSNEVNSVTSSNIQLWVSPVQSWGLTSGGQLLANPSIPSSATNVVAIAAAPIIDAGVPAMALRADGSVVSWGNSLRDVAPPSDLTNIVAISLGALSPVGYSAYPNNLLLRADGSFVHWQGGLKPPIPADPPNSNFVAVAAGGQHQLALRDDGTVAAWGSNIYGQTNVPLQATNIIAIAAGAGHNLALRVDGTVIGWGNNTLGQASVLVKAFGLVSISAGGNQSAALSVDGAARGLTYTNNQMFGAPPAYATNLTAISAGYTHTLGLQVDGKVIAWGATNSGKATVPAYTSNVVAIAAGGNISLALVDDPFDTPIPPQIARPPLSRTITAGVPAVFNTLSIGDAPMTYRWFKGGEELATQTNSFLYLPHPLPADAGEYQLVAMNAHGAATSQVCTVTIVAPKPRIEVASQGSGLIVLRFETLPGFEYRAEAADSLEFPVWQLLSSVPGGGATMTVEDQTGTQQGMRFYRVTVQ